MPGIPIAMRIAIAMTAASSLPTTMSFSSYALPDLI